MSDDFGSDIMYCDVIERHPLAKSATRTLRSANVKEPNTASK